MTIGFGKRLDASALAFAAVLAGASPANAAATDGEIIVTAQKRSENLQKVPAAVSVVQGAQIGAAVNIENVQTLVPTLTFRKGGTSLNSSLFLRGVGTINFSIAAEPSVATVLDGVVLARAGEAFGDLNDIERIEVLRGPQGTLFGKNASAGAINIVSKKPGSVHGGQIEASIFEDSDYRLKASVDLPFSEAVRSRVTAFRSSYDGNITNLTTGDKVNGYDRWGVRGIVDVKASPKLDFTFIGDYRKADDNCCTEVIGAPPAGANQAAITSLLSGVRFAGDETRQVRNNLVTATKEESWGLSAQAGYQLGDHTLTSITAFRGWDNREIREGDWLDRPAAYVGNAFAQLHDNGPQESKTFSQELRIASPSGKMLEYIAGLYYYRADADRVFTRSDVVCTASTLAIDATGQRPCATGASTFITPSSTASFGSEFTNTAAFADGRLHLNDAVTLIGGVRFTRDELSYYHSRIPAAVAGPGLRTDGTGFIGSTDNDNVSGRLGAQFQVTPSVMTYATWSRGYKGPAFNVFFNMNANQRNVIEPETAHSYEIGAKTAFFDNKLVLNLAAFDAKYKNYQANNFDTLNGVVITRLTNAGDVSTQGFEADWLLRPTDALTITGGFAYTDAQVDNFRTPAGQTQAVRPGSPLALSPKYKGTLGVDYRLESSLPVLVFLGGQYSHTSEQYSDLGQNPLLRIDGYDIFDASIGISDKQDKYRITLVGKNLTDESFASLITPGGPGGALRYQIPREADRYFGVSLRAKFGG
jgi:iron complex outermembrane receptor protein